MTTISFRRLQHLMRYDLLVSWRFGATVFSVLVLLFATIQLLMFRVFRDGNFVPEVGSDKFLMERMYENMITTYAYLACTVAIVAFVILAATLQYGALTKQERLHMLLLPARMNEKFLVRFGRSTVGMALVILLAFCFSDLLRMMLASLLGLANVGFVAFKGLGVLWANGTEAFQSEPMGCVLVLSMITVLHAFYTMCGCFFRKHPVILTLVAHQVVSIILWIAGLVLTLILVEEPQVYINYRGDDMDKYANIIGYSLIAISFLIAFAEYFIAYRLFTRQQLLGRSLMNV